MKINYSHFQYVPRYKSFQKPKIRLAAQGHLLLQCVWPGAWIQADSNALGFCFGHN